MSALGAVLVQPQKFRRSATLDDNAALVEDIVNLAGRFTADAAMGGAIAISIQDAVLALGERIEQHANAGLTAALTRVQQFLQPAIDFGKSLKPADGASPAAGLDLLKNLSLQVSSLAQDLTLDKLRAGFDTVLHILQVDLGITNTFVADQLFTLINDIASRVENVAADASPDARDNRIAFAAALRHLERRFKSEFVLPELNAEEMARKLLAAIRGTGLDPLARKAACITAGAADVADTAAKITRIIPFPLGGGSSNPPPLTAAANPRPPLTSAPSGPPDSFVYSWYATWLLGDKDRVDGNAGDTIVGILTSIIRALPLPWLPDTKDAIWIDPTVGKAYRANLFGGGFDELKDPKTQQPYQGTFATWKDLPLFKPTPTGQDPFDPHYTFNVAEADTMEGLAFHSAWSVDALRLILNLTSLEEGDWTSNTFNAILHTGHGTFKFFHKDPFLWWLPVVAGPNHHVLWWILSRTPAGTIGGSFQGLHTKAAFGPAVHFYLWLSISDGLEQYILNAVSDSLRDALLSFFTLLNQTGPVLAPDGKDTRPENRKEADGVGGLVGFLLGLAYPSPPRTDYGAPFQESSHTVRILLLWNILITAGFTMINAIAATVVTSAISRAIDWTQFLKVFGKNIFPDIIKFYPSLYLSGEGDTDDGKYNPTGGAAYDGYPSPVANSPYSLPYESEKSWQCVQGNQGLWSHNAVGGGTAQVYAYDFAMDQDEEILAARSGTVVDYFDWVPDDTHSDTATTFDAADGPLTPGQTTSDTWNFVLIRHDLDDAGNPASGNNPVAPLAAYDKDQGGATTTTYGVYGHGRKGSVRATFGVAANQIIGTRVRRGRPIMKCGNTGISAFNHLHMDVRPGPAAPSPLEPAASTTPVAFRGGSIGSRTLPFVFRDVASRLEINRFKSSKEGVPFAMNYYTSTTAKVT